MNYSKLIHDFLEGNISKKDESALFMSMSSHDELRSELKQAIKIDKAFETRLSAMAPSAKTTMGIFNKLGIVAPGAAAATAAAPKTGFFGNVFSKFGQGLVGAGIASLLFVGTYFTFLNNGNGQGPDNIQKAVPVITSIEDENKPDAKPADNINPQVNNSSEEKVKTVIKYVYIDRSADKSDDEIDPALAENTSAGDSQSPHLINSKELNNINYYNELYPEGFLSENNFTPVPAMDYEPLSKNLNIPSFYGLAFEIRAVRNWTNPESEDVHSTTPKLNNMGAAVFYELSPRMLVGLDFRQEKFYQKFEGKDQFNDLYEYRQFSNYLGISAALRYRLIYDSSYNIFGQMNLGGVQTGFLGRISGGLEITPSDSYSMIISLEGSSMLFKHQNSWWIAPKYGVNYGFNIKL